MAATIQHIELPKKPRALDSSTSIQEISQEMLANHDFDGDLSGWTLGSQATPTLVGDNMQMNSSSGNTSFAYQSLTTIVGSTYRVSGNVVTHDSNNVIKAGTSIGSSNVASLTTSGTGLFEFDFTATGTTTYITVTDTSGGAGSVYSYISVKRIENFSNNNHGKIYSGRALEFDGVSDDLLISPEQQMNGEFSLVAWFNSDEGTSADHALFGSGEHENCMRVKVSNQTLELRMNNTPHEFSFVGALNVDTWYRMVLTRDSSNNIRCFLNGIESVSGAWSNSYVLKVEHIGRGHGSWPYSGLVSDFQLWDAAWSTDDIAYDYANPESLALNASGTALTEGNLKLWYPMQDGHRGQQSYILDGANTGLGVNLITNGDFEGITLPAGSADEVGGWQNNSTTTNGWSIAGGKAFLDGEQDTTPLLRQDGVFSVPPDEGSSVYKCVVTISNRTAGDVRFNIGGYQSFESYDTNGTHTSTVKPTHSSSNNSVYIQGSSDFAGSIDNVEVYAINDKHHATTVFYGDELITDTNDRTFAGASNWLGANVNGSNTNNDFSIYNENYTGTGYEAGALQLTSDNDASNVQFAILDGASGNGWETNMVEGRTYRLSFQAAIARTSGTLSVGFANASHALSSDIRAFSDTAITPTVYTLDFVYNATNHAELIVHVAVSSAWIAFLDDISIKEVGVASGWTDADQQLDIAQPALQSYNELAWFDGVDDLVQLSDPYSHTSITVSAWVYPVTSSGTSAIFTNRDSSTDGLTIYWSGAMSFVAKLNNESMDSGTDLTPGEWQHVVFTHNGTSQAFYVNGVQVDTESNTEALSVTTNARLMKDSYANQYYSNGSITELSIWAAALTQAEVLELYNDGKALDATIHSKAIAASTNLKGYFRNNGLSTWTDLSDDYSNNGTVTASETILIPQGVDGSRDAQGFIMNRARNTSSLNFPVDKSSQTPSLDTGSYVEVSDHSGLTFGTGNFSMECWVKPSYRSKGSSSLNTIFTLGGQINDSDSAGLCTSSGSILAYIGGVSMSEGYSSNNWYHVVATREGLGSGDMKLYINGVEEATGTSVAAPAASPATGTNINNAHNMTIGAEDNRTRGYEDAVDGVKIYSKALSLTEVQRNYKATKGSHRN